MWFPNDHKVRLALDSLISDLKGSSERLKAWENEAQLLRDVELNDVLCTLRSVLDESLNAALYISIALRFAQISARQAASNLKPATQVARQIKQKLNELDVGAAWGRAVFQERYGTSRAQNN